MGSLLPTRLVRYLFKTSLITLQLSCVLCTDCLIWRQVCVNFTAFISSVHVFSWISLSLEDGHDIVLNLAVTCGLLAVLAVCNLINRTSYEL